MNLFSHVEIPVEDLDRAMRFYAAVFAVTFEDVVEIHGNRMAFFPFEAGAEGASGALAQGEVYVPTQHGAIIYFGVKDIDATLARALALGSQLIFPKTPISEHGFVAEITDSEGNRIALQTV